MLKSSQTSLLIRGLIFVGIAVFCFASPTGILASLAWVVGALLILAGIVAFLIGKKPDGKFDTLHMVLAVLMVGIGITIIVHPSIISVLVGVFLVFEGIDLLVQSLRYRKAEQSHWWWLLACSVLVIGLGIWAAFVPATGGALLGMVVGSACLLVAIESFLALYGRKKVEAFFRQATNSLHERDDFDDAEVVD